VNNDEEDHRRRLATLDRQEVDRFGRTFEELFYRVDAATMAAFYPSMRRTRSHGARR